MARAYIGTSGWNYKHWSKGVFYPEGLRQSDWLQYFCRHFDTVEINNTFYHLPEKHVFEKWYDLTPPNFRFAVKASRFVTHMKRLIDAEQHVELFLERAAGLREKLSVILFQLPPAFRFQPERLRALFEYVRRQRIVRGVRSALEIRDPSWNCDACFETLRRNNVALVFADWKGLLVEDPVTADFIFVRRHGPLEPGLHGNYPEGPLKRDAGHIRNWLRNGRDVYIYFNNDPEGHAVHNALRLKQILGGSGVKAA